MAEREIIERLDQVLSITETNESTHKITDLLTTIAEDTLIKKKYKLTIIKKFVQGTKKFITSSRILKGHLQEQNVNILMIKQT